MKHILLLSIGMLALALFLNCNPTSSNNSSTNTITDADGNVYHTVTIGTQTWTVENLRTTKYNDNTTIPLVKNDSAWQTLRTPGCSFYNNTTNADSAKKFGALYNWYAVNTKKLAPAGWHVPSKADMDTLAKYLSANGYNYDTTIWSSEVAKSMAAKTDWAISTYTAAIGNDLTKNNSSGFTALPGGSRDGAGGFYYMGRWGEWWLSTDFSTFSANYFYLNSDSFDIDDGGNNDKFVGLSVRLVKDN